MEPINLEELPEVSITAIEKGMTRTNHVFKVSPRHFNFGSIPQPQWVTPFSGPENSTNRLTLNRSNPPTTAFTIEILEEAYLWVMGESRKDIERRQKRKEENQRKFTELFI